MRKYNSALFTNQCNLLSVIVLIIIFAGFTPVAYSQSIPIEPAQANDAADSPDGKTPGVNSANDDSSKSSGENPNQTEPPVGSKAPRIAENEPLPPIMRDLGKLPFPVRRMRELILEAATSGDLEKLRPLIGFGDDVTMLSLGGIDEDPLAFLKSLSGDEAGHEILAILVEVLESGFVHLDEGTEQELYVWPYYFAWPLDKLTPKQKVELYQLITHGDYQDMESFGAYIFYRVGITPRGRWRFFVAGD